MTQLLKGLRVLNTRPKHQAHQLTQDIRAAGGCVIELPALDIQPTHNSWIDNLPNLNHVDTAIFISANAVYYCLTQFRHHRLNWPSSIKVIAMGHGTAALLKKFNIAVSAIPELPDSEHLLALAQLNPIQKQNVLLFKGAGGRLLVEEQLTQKGATLVVLKVYQRVMPKIDPVFVQSIWHDDLVDIILITSEQSLHNLFQLFDKEAHDWLKKKTWITLSERLAQCASSFGIGDLKISHPNQILRTLIDSVNKDSL